MLEKFRNYIEGKGRCIRVFREKADSVVALVQYGAEKRVCRMYARPVPAYEIAARLSCAALPTVYRCERFEDGCCLVEEEFVDGISLAELLEVYHPDDSQTAAIAAQICTALSALHDEGVIHRDVKPENVLITSAGRVVLIDLDAATEYDEQKTRDTTLLGTAGYAAPEQFGFSRSNVRTDIFSLGIMMNVMLTGEHPSTRLTDGALRAVIEKCIEINLDKRYTSAAELKRAIEKRAGAPAVCPECGFVSPGGGCLCCGTASAHRPLHKSRKRILPALILALLLVVCACIFLPREHTQTPKPEISSAPETPAVTPMLPDAPQSTPQETPQTEKQQQLYYSRHVSKAQIEEIAYANADLRGVMVYFWLDAEGTQPLPSDCELRTSEGVGEIVYSAEHECWLWDTLGVLPTYQNTETGITTLVDGVEYGMTANTLVQLYPLYTVPGRDPSIPNDNYLPMSEPGTYHYSFTELDYALYAIPVGNYSCDTETIVCDGAAFSCTYNAHKSMIEIRYLGDLSKRESCRISFKIKFPNSLDAEPMKREFSVVHVPTEEQKIKQLYTSFPASPGQTVFTRMQLPAENRTNPLFWLDENKETPVPKDAVFTLTPGLGSVTRDEANQWWWWSTENATPGTEGWVSVEVDGVIYRTAAMADRPWYALYTEPYVDPSDPSKNYIYKDEEGKMTFHYSADKRTVYIIPLPNLTIDMKRLVSSSDLFEFSFENGVLHVTLREGYSGLAETKLGLQGTMPGNESDFPRTLHIVFSPE